MANGTGTTTGPYTISGGQTLSLNDPAVWSGASEQVQIQNNTGYNIYLQTAGAGYNIQPFTASTIPCAGGQTLVGFVTATANVQTGFLIAVWLLHGQTAPMQDGPMTVYPKNTHALTVNGGGGGNWTLQGFYSTDTLVTMSFQYYFGTGATTYIWLVGNVGGNYGPSNALVSGGGFVYGSATISNLIVGANTYFTIYYGNSTAPTAPITTQISTPVATAS
jgi:hypothetical protein